MKPVKSLIILFCLAVCVLTGLRVASAREDKGWLTLVAVTDRGEGVKAARMSVTDLTADITQEAVVGEDGRAVFVLPFSHNYCSFAIAPLAYMRTCKIVSQNLWAGDFTATAVYTATFTGRCTVKPPMPNAPVGIDAGLVSSR